MVLPTLVVVVDFVADMTETGGFLINTTRCTYGQLSELSRSKSFHVESDVSKKIIIRCHAGCHGVHQNLAFETCPFHCRHFHFIRASFSSTVNDKTMQTLSMIFRSLNTRSSFIGLHCNRAFHSTAFQQIQSAYIQAPTAPIQVKTLLSNPISPFHRSASVVSLLQLYSSSEWVWSCLYLYMHHSINVDPPRSIWRRGLMSDRPDARH